MKYFRLVGQEMLFVPIWRGDYHGISCIKGISLNGRFETLARIEDVIFLPS